jgi:hypothetical protein
VARRSAHDETIGSKVRDSARNPRASARALVPVAPPELIETVQHEHEVVGAELDPPARLLLRPRKRAALEPARDEPVAAAIEVQDLDPVASAVAEDEERARQRSRSRGHHSERADGGGTDAAASMSNTLN